MKPDLLLRFRQAAWSLTIATIVLYGLQLLLLVVTSAPDDRAIAAFWPVPFVGMTVVGRLVASRHPLNTTGWLLLGAGSMMTANALTQSYAEGACLGGMQLPAASLVAWLSSWTWIPPVIAIAVALTVFPTGSPPSPVWRWFIWGALALALAIPLAALPILQAPCMLIIEAPTPASIPGGKLLESLSNISSFLLPAALVAVLSRFRRAHGAQRQQIKWFLFAASLLGLATLVLVLLPTEDPMAHPIGAGSVLVAMTALPVAIAFAILRYRLYDIDLLINRTLVYSVLTGVLAAVYFAFVAILQAAFRAMAGQDSPLAIVVSTLAIAALFNPVRRRIQAAVDRRFYRSKYDAAHMLAAFASTARDEMDAEQLMGSLLETVEESLRPAHVSLWLAPQGTRRPS